MPEMKFEYAELLLIVLGAIGIVAIPSGNPAPPEINYVPNAVTGFATISGILMAL